MSKLYPEFVYTVIFLHICWFQMALSLSIFLLHIIPVVVYSYILKFGDFINLIEEYQASNVNRVMNEMYHKNITMHLVFVYKQHLKLMTYLHKFTRSSMIKFIGGIFLLVGLCFMPLLVFCMSNFSIIQALLISLAPTCAYFFSTFISFNVAQIIEDQFEDMYYALINMPWYLWNQENKNIYLVLLNKIQKGNQIYIGFNMPLNRNSLLLYIRNTYAFITFLYQTNVFRLF
ncbi:uncharacterized protein LOC143204942 [Rhynchophorus ferrugineus]|uniref:uncharacterized protein LOC143204942 n=1 Tax=Rhynchophorus ferrugineus TaxID=354439 RepID=UPI003FCC2E1E